MDFVEKHLQISSAFFSWASSTFTSVKFWKPDVGCLSQLQLDPGWLPKLLLNFCSTPINLGLRPLPCFLVISRWHLRKGRATEEGTEKPPAQVIVFAQEICSHDQYNGEEHTLISAHGTPPRVSFNGYNLHSISQNISEILWRWDI